MSNEFLKSMTFASASSSSSSAAAAAGRAGGGLGKGEGLEGGFGFGRPSSCDCDECSCFLPGSGSSAQIPSAIREAVRRRKRQRLETGPIRRTQQRTFVCRKYHHTGSEIGDAGGGGAGAGGGGTISMYDVTMPLNAEPLIEFGTSHRMVYVKRLAPSSVVESIGEGIIGSQDEETTRRRLADWTEGSVVLVPSTDGKAVGWIHKNSAYCTDGIDGDKDGKKLATTTSSDSDENSTKPKTGKDEDLSLQQDTTDVKKDTVDSHTQNKTDDDATSTSSGAYAVLCVCKIPQSLIDLDDDDDDADGGSRSTSSIDVDSSNNDNGSNKEEDWAMTMMKYCRKGLAEVKNRKIKKTPRQSSGQDIDDDDVAAEAITSSSSSSSEANSYYRFEDGGEALQFLKSAFDQAKAD